MGEFWMFDYHQSGEESNEPKGPPLDLTKVKNPQNLEELKHLAKGRGKYRHIYQELDLLFGTARKARAITTDDDLSEFCNSWLNGTELWEQMFNEGLQMETEESVRGNFKMMIDMIHNVRTEALCEEFLKPIMRRGK